MKKIEEYLDSLSIADYITAYGDIKKLQRTGMCPAGVLRTLAKMCKDVTGTFDISFAQKLVLERIADMWYRQNN